MGRIVLLTGAGISAESGLGTFRDMGGLWEQHRLEDVATPEGFARNPQLVHDFYNARRVQAAKAKPNAAHLALAELQRAGAHQVTLVTQNVDALHEAAGSAEVIHMHGTLGGALCAACEHRWTAPLEMHPADTCSACSEPTARPDIVWFGEMPYFMDQIEEALLHCEIFAAIGTSGEVYPAAGFAELAGMQGTHLVELNLEPSAGSRQFDDQRLGPATQTVPAWVAELLDAH